MKADLKKPLRAVALFSFVEIVVTFLAGTIAWAVASHDLSALDGSFYERVWADTDAKIVGGLAALILLINLVGAALIATKGQKLVAGIALVMAGAIASLFFLPMRFTVAGLCGLVGLLVVYKTLGLFWKIFSWPFKKIFRRTAKEAAPQPKAAPAKKPS